MTNINKNRIDSHIKSLELDTDYENILKTNGFNNDKDYIKNDLGYKISSII